MCKYNFFISHSSEDRHVVDKIVAAIENCGYRCWVSPRNIPAGVPYARAIMNGIIDSDEFLLIITKDSIASDDVLGELDNAHARKKKIIPIRLSQTELSPEFNYYLSKTQWISLDGQPVENIVELLKLKKQDIKEPKPKAHEQEPEKPEALEEQKERRDTNPILPAVKEVFNKKFLYFCLIFAAVLCGLDYFKSHDSKNDGLLNSAVEKLNNGYYQSAKDIFEKLSAQGNDTADYYLGVMYQSGLGVSYDGEKYEKYYRSAASRGNAWAQNNLVNFLTDKDSAYYYYRRSAEQECAAGQNNLGVRYHDDGNYAEALRWFRRAVQNGSTMAKVNIGIMHYFGMGMPMNKKMAAREFSMAEENPIAQFYLANLFLDGEGVEKQDYTIALQLFKSSADNGFYFANYPLAIMYQNGWGVDKDIEKADELISVGNKPREIIVDTFYCENDFCTNGNFWSEKYAGDGIVKLMRSVGWNYLEGWGGQDKNYSKALYWLSKAAEKNDATALEVLARMYREGNGVVKNTKKAIELFNAAANLGEHSCFYRIAKIYDNEQPRNEKEALKYYKKYLECGETLYKAVVENRIEEIEVEIAKENEARRASSTNRPSK